MLELNCSPILGGMFLSQKQNLQNFIHICKFKFYFRYKTGEIGLMMSRTKLSKHILHKDIELKLEEVGQ